MSVASLRLPPRYAGSALHRLRIAVLSPDCASLTLRRAESLEPLCLADRMNLADRDGDGAGLAAALVQPVLDWQTGDLLQVADVPGDDR